MKQPKLKLPHSTIVKASDVARILNISRALSYQLMQSGKIPVIKFNRTVRVKPSDLEVFILQNRGDNKGQLNPSK